MIAASDHNGCCQGAVLDRGLLDHSVNSADRAANLSSDSTDGEVGSSNRVISACRIASQRNDRAGTRCRATRFVGNLRARQKAPSATGTFVILPTPFVYIVG
jgi:hypothetical protein